MSGPQKYSLLEAFDSRNNKVISFSEMNQSYRIAIKSKDRKTDGTQIYVSRVLTEPLKKLLEGKVNMNLATATTRELNSMGWQRLSDF